jgi:hypothetical protein
MLFIDRLVVLLRAQEFDQGCRPDQAADMGGENAVRCGHEDFLPK